MKKETIKRIIQWITKQPIVVQILMMFATILTLIAILIGTSSCTTTHKVIQSSASEIITSGDSTITKTTITYEQQGKSKKGE